MTAQRPDAVLWDQDGTLVDTEPYWQRSQTALVESFGGTWTHEQTLTLVGQGLGYSARALRDAGVDLPLDDIVSRMTDDVIASVTERMPWRPGARELLSALREAGVRTALVTMSIAPLALHVAASLGFDGFDVVVSGDEVEHPKPQPDAYLLAAERLGVAASRCLAFEDSGPGIAAASAAGCVTVGIPHVVPVAQTDAWRRWETLAGRSVDDVFAEYAAGVRT